MWLREHKGQLRFPPESQISLSPTYGNTATLDREPRCGIRKPHHSETTGHWQLRTPNKTHEGRRIQKNAEDFLHFHEFSRGFVRGCLEFADHVSIITLANVLKD